jgi:hypothetical protein
VSAAEGWTIEEAVAEFGRAGVPVDPYRFRMAVRAVQLRPVGETASGRKGGRGQHLYEIGQLQRLHSALAPWMTIRDPPPGDT